MSNFGHVKRITMMTDKGEITFRSRFEAWWSVWCDLRQQQGLITDWSYEDEDSWHEVDLGHRTDVYRPDFTLLMPNGDFVHEETKGYFQGKDLTKMKACCKQWDIELVLIFEAPPKGIGYRRAKSLEPFLQRIIWDAKKTIWQPIKGLCGHI